MIERILPSTVVTADAFADPPGVTLLPGEEQLVARAIEHRRSEFTTTRHCAHHALASLGLPWSPLLAGPRREPLWPAGVVGSLTHCAGFRGAAVAHRAQVVSLGIDAEPADALPDGVLGLVARPDELDQLRRLSGSTPWDRLLFSAKESIYKTLSPLGTQRLSFHDVSVDFHPHSLDADVRGDLQARLHVPGPVVDGARLRRVEGKFLIADGLLLTAAVVLPVMPGDRRRG